MAGYDMFRKPLWGTLARLSGPTSVLGLAGPISSGMDPTMINPTDPLQRTRLIRERRAKDLEEAARMTQAAAQSQENALSGNRPGSNMEPDSPINFPVESEVNDETMSVTSAEGEMSEFDKFMNQAFMAAMMKRKDVPFPGGRIAGSVKTAPGPEPMRRPWEKDYRVL